MGFMVAGEAQPGFQKAVRRRRMNYGVIRRRAGIWQSTKDIFGKKFSPGGTCRSL
jgi:hypothetical protein